MIKIEIGDIVEVINLGSGDKYPPIGSRYIAISEPYMEPYPKGQINVLNSHGNPIILQGGQYTLYKKNPLKVESI